MPIFSGNGACPILGVTGTDALDFKGGAFSPARGGRAAGEGADLDALPSADTAN